MKKDSLERASQTPEAGEPLAALITKAKAGDRSAFGELVAHFQQDIFRLVYVRTHNRMDAEDLTQEIFLQAFKHLPSLKSDDRFRSWLYSVAVNRVRDYHRKQRFLSLFGLSAREDRQEVPDTEPDREPGALERMLRQEFWLQVRQLSRQFSPLEREVFFLRFVDHLGIHEIAEVLHKSESAVKTHLYRSIKKFKDNPLFVQLSGEEVP